jgi:hypothetical protein
MPVSIDAKQYIIGAADVYWRAVATLGPWISIGATVNNVIFRVHQTTVNPSDQFNGLMELIREMDYVTKQSAEAEFEMPQIAGPNLALALRGVTSTTLATTDSSGSPFVTTLAAASAVGDTNVKVTAVTNAALGQTIGIDVVAGGLREYRVITFVGTLGAGGTGISFRDPLLRAHANGVAVTQTVGDGKTELAPGNVRRTPLAAYNDYVMVAQSPTDYYELYAYNGITTSDPVEISFGDATMAAIKVLIGTRDDGLNLALPSWKLRVP